MELAEDFVAMVPHADWAMFQKNGGDATTACVTIARAGTGRRKVLVAQGSYHGALPWCSPSVAGVTSEDRAHLLHFEYNDVASLQAAVDEAGKDLAAILVTGFPPRYGRAISNCRRANLPQRHARHATPPMPRSFSMKCAPACGSMSGEAGKRLACARICAAWSKAIANGYALAAVTGNDKFREAATKVFVTGSFWCGTVAMAAARATLRIARETDVPGHIRAMGLRLREGLASLANENGIAIRQSGPPQMPLMLFDADPDVKKGPGVLLGGAAPRRVLPSRAQHVPVISASARRYRCGAGSGLARLQGRPRPE